MNDPPDWISALPAVNAGLNFAATVLLIAGYLLIRAKHVRAHKTVMLTAFVVSIAFLSCYLTYHFGLRHYTGSSSRPFPADHAGRPLYLAILLTHVVLAIAVPPLAIVTILRALRQKWDQHRRLARITFPIWLYVSVTGVIIYWMLYHWVGEW